MSISSLISPSGEPSVQDSLWHIALSTNSGQTDFKYVYDIFSGTNQLIRVKIYPDPTNGRGYFDAGNVVRNEITYDWFTPVNNTDYALLNEPNVSGQVAVTYQIRVGEDYSGTTYLNLASGNVTAYNWAAPLFNRRVADSSSMYYKWFTNRPKVIRAKSMEKILIPYRVGETTGVYIKTIVNGTTTYTNTLHTVNSYQQCDIGIDTLNSYYDGDIASDFGNDYRRVTYYDVSIYSDVEGQVGESIRVYLDCEPRYTNVNLYFINAWGMFDTAAFGLASRLTMDTERKAFQQREYSLNTTSVSYYNSNNVYNESKINYGSKSNWTYKLTMNYPTDAEYEWLAELITSPQIYAELEGAYYPVTIKATNYEYSKYQNNKLKVFEVEIEMNQTRYGFLR